MFMRATTFVGIDPGFTGAIGSITENGLVSVTDLPTIRLPKKPIEFDVPLLVKTLQAIYNEDEQSFFALEFPSTRPGEGAERSKRFGHGIGLVEGVLACLNAKYERVYPNQWKGCLGIPGKTDPRANQTAAAFLEAYYPAVKALIRGPKGGLLDGRIDALLIAHYIRTRHYSGLRNIVQKFGKGSAQALLPILTGGRRGRKSLSRLPL